VFVGNSVLEEKIGCQIAFAVTFPTILWGHLWVVSAFGSKKLFAVIPFLDRQN
jgi:hypothetical protein